MTPQDVNYAFHDLKVGRQQIMPRLRQILVSWSSLVAIVAAVITTIGTSLLPARGLPITTVAGIGFTYASISMAACISGLVLSLALPGESRMRKWANMGGAVDGKSLLSDLLFSFFWAACCQLAVLLVCVLATIFGGPLLIGSPSPLPLSHVLALGAALFVFFYAVAQLYVVLQTLVQVGVLVILEEWVAVPPTGEGREQAEEATGP